MRVTLDVDDDPLQAGGELAFEPVRHGGASDL
jgi:hypothetical protein